MNHADIDYEWEQLAELCYSSSSTYITAQENQSANRYPNILAMDSTRVRLSNGQYINANYVEILEGYKCIATQAPMLHTVDNFWHMVFENEISAIVMLTKLVENSRVKATAYWPSANYMHTTTDQKLTIKLLSDQVVTPTIFIRNVEVSDGTRSKVVKHIHFTGWPDFGVPDNYNDILAVVDMVLDSSGFPVVHCSAGVGRAGTFLALLIYNKAQREKINVKVPQIIGRLREQRTGSVQTKEQFCFIYSCIQYQNRTLQQPANTTNKKNWMRSSQSSVPVN